MNFEATKTPLLIAAIAAAVTLTSLAPANAATLGTSTNAQNVQLVNSDLSAPDSTYNFKTLGKSNQIIGQTDFGKQKSAPKQSFAKKKAYEPKYSFAKKKGLSRLF